MSQMPETEIGNNRKVNLTLDGVEIEIRTPFLPQETFVKSSPGDSIQTATWSNWRPVSELTVIAVPFGTSPGSESVPVSAPGKAVQYHQALRQAREEKHSLLFIEHAGPVALLFGEEIKATVSLVDLPVSPGEDPAPMLFVEWVAEAGRRLWIVRVSYEMDADTRSLSSVDPFVGLFTRLVISSDIELLSQPTTVNPLADQAPAPDAGLDQPEGNPGEGGIVAEADEAPVIAAGNILPTPSWWTGDCDLQHYRNAPANAQHRPSKRINVGYMGVPVCGPRPSFDGVPDVLVTFPGGHGEFEWECVELSMRFMFLAYGIRAYQANGYEVVRNYRSTMHGDKLVAMSNEPVAPAPVPGDVLSYDVTYPGHTSVCIASNVDAEGNGSIRVMEQNYSASGVRDLQVKRFQVIATPRVTGFLHKPGNNEGNDVTPDTQPIFFQETNQHVSHGFKALWQKPGNGLFLCGLPLTGEMDENGITVQYFENVRMEFQLGSEPRFGPLGTLFKNSSGSDVPDGIEPQGPDVQQFDTGHSVGGQFLKLHNKYGLPICGKPITGEIQENNIRVQYFQNVRMEVTPGLPARFGAVGARYCKLKGLIA